MRSNPPIPDDDGRRGAILDAAATVFAEEGFAGARVDDIARRAGVNKAMLYYHVGDKRALYTAVLMRSFDRVQTTVAVAMSEATEPAERLARVITSLTDIVTTYPEHPRMVLREVASGARNLPDDVLRRMLEVAAAVRSVLEEGVAGGSFRRTDPLLTHLAIIGAVVFMSSVRPLAERAGGLAADGRLPGHDVDVAAFLSDLLLRGLLGEGP